MSEWVHHAMQDVIGYFGVSLSRNLIMLVLPFYIFECTNIKVLLVQKTYYKFPVDFKLYVADNVAWKCAATCSESKNARDGPILNLTMSV